MKFALARPFAAACLCLGVLLGAASAQTREPLSNNDAFELYGRGLQLMESTSVTIPELVRAAGPINENVRHAVTTLRELGRQHAGLTYTFVTNLRAYLALADAVPKPDPFPELAAKQFAELRDVLTRADANFRALLDSKESQLRSPDRDELARYAEANAKIRPPQPGQPRVVFLGDSITDAWRLNEYFGDRDVINRGIGGQVTSQMLARMKADVIDLRPEAVLVLAGTNDIARSAPLGAIENNLSMIADLAAAHNIKPLFASVLPVSDYHKDVNPAFEMTKVRPPQQIAALNEWIRAFCRERNYIYVDYFSAMADANGLLKSELADDGLHPNSQGYRVMAPLALAAIDKTAAPQAKPKKRRWPL